jgi:trigger factor
MNRLVAQAAQQYAPQDRERFVEYVRNEPMAAAQLRAPLYEDKVVDFLFEKAEVAERTVARADLEAAIESEEGGHVHGPDCGHDHSHDKPATKAAAKKPAKKAEAEDAAVEAEAPAKKAPAKKAAKSDTTDEAAAEKPAKKPAAKKAKAASSEA